ncbi:histone-lysine N-methyltransferase 2B isoform X1 [Parasteatoda tepidariorum]|uniref:histone-lysine N-methyltransferase 2B isoform X1 n=1 Tax=Parasteatoda tepidariorum TaxID=114398 RepID=UPI001C726677|nr:histone-lysine N-methyltransferase trithorax isoform X2 [Parasteatoda tepidariorum]
MYFKHVRLYKRHANIKKSRRKVTLSHFDEALRCYALIIKMARLRFPGRPGQRIGKNYIKYIYDDIKMPIETCVSVHNKIEVGLKLFHELFGYSDEEEDFEGFTSDDVAEAEAALALKLTEKQAVQRYLSSTSDPPSGASDIEKLFSATDSDASSTSSIRQKRGMRDIVRKSYDKMIKEGLCKSVNNNSVAKDKVNVTLKNPVKSDNQTCTDLEHCSKQIAIVNNLQPTGNNFNSDASNDLPTTSQKKSIVKRLLENVKTAKTRGRHKKVMQPNVKKKLRRHFGYSSKKHSHLKKRLISSTVRDHKSTLRNRTFPKNRSAFPKTSHGFEGSSPDNSSVKIMKDETKLRSKRTRQPGVKKFVLPPRSARSSRKIIPRKRYADDAEMGLKREDEESQCSRSSFSGSSETTSAMDGGSSPDDSQNEDMSELKCKGKKVGLLDRPLVVEGKRPWKPSLKVQMKLSEMNYEHPFALKKSGDGSSGTNTSSGSFKDIIKPDMVSKYAEKMAQKPKEKPVKPLESFKKYVPQSARNDAGHSEKDCDESDDKKPEDKLEKVAAKIEKLLKSQWEGRLKDSTVQPNNLSTNLVSAVTQWKNEHHQRSSNQRRTKNIIRKARLQLKKKNLNLRTRKLVKDSSEVVADGKVNSKTAKNIADPVISVSTDPKEVPLKSAPLSQEPNLNVGCAVCGFCKIFSSTEKLYDQVACEPCNKFFESFAKSPKQYFCLKEGMCCIDCSKEPSRKLLNARCKACWIKICMEKFTVSTLLRSQLIKYVPRLDSPPHNPLVKDLARFAEGEEESDHENPTDKPLPLSIDAKLPVTSAKQSTNFIRETRARTKRASESAAKDPKLTEGSGNVPSPVVEDASLSMKVSSDISRHSVLSLEKNLLNQSSHKIGMVSETPQSLSSDVTSTEVKQGKSNIEESIDSKIEGIPRGPRIKHVCRRAAIALGLPRATFPKQNEPKEAFNLSALPQEEKQRILDAVPAEETVKVSSIEMVAPEVKVSPVKVKKEPNKRKAHKSVKLKNQMHLDLLKKSSLLFQKEQKRRKLLLKKSMKHLHKHSFKKSLKLGRRSEMKKTLKFSYKSAVKTTSVKRSQRTSTKKLRTGKLRKVRCKQCEGCLADDCGKCAYCLDKKKFGGPDTIKQACMYRRCLRPVLPASERKGPKQPIVEGTSKDKLSGDHSNFGGDGPSGIGLMLTSSSSSPTSPDNSSCGSSCSSSSTSSSSGSSGSSSSSSSGSSSSSSSSSSDNLSLSQTSTLCDNNIKTPFLHNSTLGPDVTQNVDCSDVNVVTNPVFQVTNPVSFFNEEFRSESDFGELVHCGLPETNEKKLCNGTIVNKENGDTILYENSSSIIQLKNASYTPSLMYEAAMGTNESNVSYSSNNGGCRNPNSRRNSNNRQQSQYNQDQDQYGSAGSGDQDSNDEDDDGNEDNYKKHFIYADYWEDYDFERISSQGFALITSQQVPLPCVCYLCGSAGQEKLIFCVLCCEPYHTFCLPENDVPHEENIENWCCKRCQSCAVCGLKSNLLKCKKCQNTYHSDCLTPHYPTKPSRKKRIWMCPKCVKCKSCGTTSPASSGGPLWNFDLLLCQSCAKLTDKGNYCPVCHKCYEENDYESEMVQCFDCLRWVHAACDNISAEGYEILSCLPDSVVYTCINCTDEVVPTWRKAIKEYLKHGLKNVLNTLMASRCANHLINLDQSYQKRKIPDYMMAKQAESVSRDEPSNRKEDDRNPFFIDEVADSTDSTDVKRTISAIVKSVDDVSACMKNMLNKCEESSSSKHLNECSPTTVDNVVQSAPKERSEEKNVLFKKKKSSLDLSVIRFNLDKGKYSNIASFFEDVLYVIDANSNMGKKHNASAAKVLLTKQTEKIFPWFKIPTSKVWTSKSDLPEGMLPNAVIPPYVDHTYSQYLERRDYFPKIKNEVLPDARFCVLCGYAGDSNPKKCGRLLYCGQDDWIHLNCAMWSAEVFQQPDGSLRNVYPAISRGKLMPCEFCNQVGATVGCCVRGCPANYHFYCARKDEAVLQEDKKIFCAVHKDNVDERVVNEDDFITNEKIFVNQISISPKWVKNEWENPMDKDSLKIKIGSLTVSNLGRLTPLSNGPNVLIPVDFECTKLFWSTKNPRVRVKYTCRIFEKRPEKCPPLFVPNTTIVHSIGTSKSSDKKIALNSSNKSNFEKVTVFHDGKSSRIECDNFDVESNDVKKLLNYITKKVAKKEKKLRNLHELKEYDLSKCLGPLLENKKEKTLNGFRFNNNLINEEMKKDICDMDSNYNKIINELASKIKNKTLKDCDIDYINKNDYLDFYTSLFKIKSNSDILCDDKLHINHELLQEFVKKNGHKKFKKRLRSLSLDERFRSKANKEELISNHSCAKENCKDLLDNYEDDFDKSSKKRAFLDSIIPLDSVNETVLPVFSVEVKDNSGKAESSGYSSNDDNLKQSGRSFMPDILNNKIEIAQKEKPVKHNSMLQRLEECRRAGNTTYKKDSQPDWQTSFLNSNHSVQNSNIISNCLNGVCQETEPLKCNKCKRIYRTSESFKKHFDACNFVIDSSSSGEESDSSSSNDSMHQSSYLNHKVPNHCDIQKKENSSDSNHCIIPACDNNQDTINKPADPLFKTFDGQLTDNGHIKGSMQHRVEQKVVSKLDMAVMQDDYPVPKSSTIIPSNSNYGISQQNLATHDIPYQSKSMVPQNTLVSATIQQNIQIPININQNSLTSQGIISNISVNNAAIATESISNSYNCSYGNTAVCNNSASTIMQLPCNTLIIPSPSTHNTVHPPTPMYRQITIPPNSFVQTPIEMTQSSQLSYVGSITITNNETMSIAVNVPDQILPMYPQQDLSFNLIHNPLQLQQTSEIHLSSVNVQQISLQSSYQTPSINQLVFPQQSINIPQNQVMFVEEPLTHQLSAPQASNYIIQVPMEQTQNCSFNTFVQQPEYHQVVNPISFDSNSQTVTSSLPQNVFQEQNNLQQSEAPPHLEPAVTPQNFNINNCASTKKQPSNIVRPISSQAPSLAKVIMPSMTPHASSPGTSDFSERSSPVSEKSFSDQNCVNNISSNSNIMEILKKAAEQMLNMSSEKSKHNASSSHSSSNIAAEKKTRFAHTRKVAARKAEQMKRKNPVLNGNVKPEKKPKSIQFNIAALKQAFMPFLVAPVAKDEPNPVPVKNEISNSSLDVPVETNLPLHSDIPIEPNLSLPLNTPAEPQKSGAHLPEEDSDVYSYNEESDDDSPLLKLHMQEIERREKRKSPSPDKPYLMYEITSEDGFKVQSKNIRDAWERVYEELQDARIAAHMDHKTVSPEDINGFHLMGLDNSALLYLLEQLPGAKQCPDYEFLFHRPTKDQFEVPENPTGCARSECLKLRSDYDMFNFLASEHRSRPMFVPPEEEDEGTQKSSRRATNIDIPIAMRFKSLKSVARETVGVFRSSIHGRGLFCKRTIDPGELVIEYAGEVIRSILTDKRERIYQSKGIGCYMFRIDDDEVVDATMHGNAARFINHSCEPNCFSKVITVDGKKHIVIFALRKIMKGEELTYDYKFPFEDEKIPCHCNSRRCRKYLN